MAFNFNRLRTECPDCHYPTGPWDRRVGWFGTVMVFIAYTASFIIFRATPLIFIALKKEIDWGWPEKHFFPILLSLTLVFLGIIKAGWIQCPRCKLIFKIASTGEVRRYK